MIARRRTGPDAGQPLEDRLHRVLRAPAPVEAKGDAVRLVANALKELQRRARAVEDDRGREARNEDLLLALRERDDRDPRQVELLDGGERRGELPLPAVDDDEVRHPREALVLLGRPHAREPPRHRLAHRADVVLTARAPDRERSGSARSSASRRRRPSSTPTIDSPWMLETSKHSIRTGRLSRFSTSRSSSSAAIRFEPRRLPHRRVRLERELRVLGGELDEPPLLASQRRSHDDARAAPLAEELRERARRRRSRAGSSTSGGTLGDPP